MRAPACPGFAPLWADRRPVSWQQGLPVIKDGQGRLQLPAHVALVRKLAASYKNGGLFRDKLFSEDKFPDRDRRL